MADDVLLVLHALRLRSLAPSEVVATRLGLPVDAVDVTIAACAERGWVRHRDGRLSGWSLTPEGRAEGERLLAREAADAGVAGAVDAAYGRFMVLNPQLLAICTDWQVVDRGGEQVPNDHADPDHDATVLERLDVLHAEAVPVTDRLSALLDRFAGYTERLDTAMGKVRAGDTDWITKPMIDSYHTVWFELHEDLLATLGRHRGDEA